MAELVERRLAPGTRVRVTRANPPWHHRVPGYVRGCTGTVLLTQGVWNRPDDSANGVEPPRKELVVSVVFASRELWGVESEGYEVVVDVWIGDLDWVEEQ